MQPRTLTIFGSVIFHGLIAVAALLYVGRPHPHAPQSIAVMGEKKKEPPKPAPPPPPRPKQSHPIAIPAPAAPAPPREPARPITHSTAPTVSGTLSNDGPATHGSGGTAAPGPGSGAPGPGPGSAQAVAPKHAPPVEGECTEAPTKAQPVSRPSEIEYTQAARADGIEGRLVLKIIVGANGAVTDVFVVSSVDPALDAAAIAAVKSWVFKPALRCGKPMAGGTYTLAQRFELGD